MKKTLLELEAKAKSCDACELCKTRTNTVFSDGSACAKIMLIGEAPGADEDRLLERQKDLYIANTLKCRPPQNRKPQNTEKDACRSFLDAQIKAIKPKVVILCGATAMESFLDKKLKISKARGQIFENLKGYEGIKFIPILHPSYLLRQHSLDIGSPRDLTLKDLIMIKKTALD